MKDLTERRHLHMGCGESLWHRSADRFGDRTVPRVAPTAKPLPPQRERPRPSDTPSLPLIDPGRRG